MDSNLSLHSLPNPYPVPERDFSLRFLPPLQALPKATVELCISQTFHRLIRHIRKYGDGQIPMILRIQTKTVELYVYRGIADLHLSYNDTVAIVEVLDLKLKHDGWKELFAHIELTTQVHVVQLGIAGIRRM